MLAFVTRPQAPPAPETVSLLSGVIAGGALIVLSNAAPAWQVSRQPLYEVCVAMLKAIS